MGGMGGGTGGGMPFRNPEDLFREFFGGGMGGDDPFMGGMGGGVPFGFGGMGGHPFGGMGGMGRDGTYIIYTYIVVYLYDSFSLRLFYPDPNLLLLSYRVISSMIAPRVWSALACPPARSDLRPPFHTRGALPGQAEAHEDQP